jgi:hypothetical protein
MAQPMMAASPERNLAFVPPPPLPPQEIEVPEYSATMADAPNYSNTYLKYIFGSITAFALYFLLSQPNVVGSAVKKATKTRK